MQAGSVQPVGRTLWGVSALTFRSDPFLRQGGVLALSMLLLHGANWLYLVVMSRALGPVEYGGLSAMLGLLLLFTVPAQTIQMGMSAFVARRRSGPAEGGIALGDWLSSGIGACSRV